MKHMKKLAALLLALVMALALAVPAMAAEETVEVGTTGHTIRFIRFLQVTRLLVLPPWEILSGVKESMIIS